MAHAISTKPLRITKLRSNCVNGFSSPYETPSARMTMPQRCRERFSRRSDVPGSAALLFSSEMPWNWLALAAAIVLVALVASSLLPRLQQPGADQFLATQLIASHVRSLMANHLMDVASSDQHTVNPGLMRSSILRLLLSDLARSRFSFDWWTA